MEVKDHARHGSPIPHMGRFHSVQVVAVTIAEVEAVVGALFEAHRMDQVAFDSYSSTVMDAEQEYDDAAPDISIAPSVDSSLVLVGVGRRHVDHRGSVVEAEVVGVECQPNRDSSQALDHCWDLEELIRMLAQVLVLPIEGRGVLQRQRLGTVEDAHLEGQERHADWACQLTGRYCVRVVGEP